MSENHSLLLFVTVFLPQCFSASFGNSLRRIKIPILHSVTVAFISLIYFFACKSFANPSQAFSLFFLQGWEDEGRSVYMWNGLFFDHQWSEATIDGYPRVDINPRVDIYPRVDQLRKSTQCCFRYLLKMWCWWELLHLPSFLIAFHLIAKNILVGALSSCSCQILRFH